VELKATDIRCVLSFCDDWFPYEHRQWRMFGLKWKKMH